MRIFVLGNINSGKSYLIKNISKILPNYDILKIDDYRINHCDGTLESELKMWHDFPNEIMKYENAIIELSGGGRVSDNIVKLLDNNSFIVLKLNTNVKTCLLRNKNKDFSLIPYPKEFNEPIEETIKRVGKDMDNKSIEKVWSKALNIIELSNDSNLFDLPLIQYHLLFKLKSSLSDYKGSLFTFGSTGRGMMKNTSDVDTYFLTDVPKELLFDNLNNQFNEVRLMADEFIIRENGVLLEMNYINDINKASLFYNRSLIANPLKTILKDDYNIVNNLINFSNQQFDKLKEINYTIERLNYYVESLPVLIKKNDEYKYFFHNNIVVHEYVKLSAFLNEVFDFSYLPIQAKKYLTDDEWNKIIYSFGDDQNIHYKIVREMSDIIIKKVKDKYAKE